MKNFKVIALSCSGKGKRIYSSGDIIAENGFPEGTIEELIKGKFIEEINEEKIEINSEEKIEVEVKKKKGK